MKNAKMTICLMAAVLFITGNQVFGLVEFKDGGTHNINYTIDDDVWVDNGAPGMHTKVNLLTGGSINFDFSSREDSEITMLDGTVVKYLAAHNNSHITMSGGSVESCLYAVDNASVTMSGGWVSLLRAQGSSQVTMSGGLSDRGLEVYDSGQLIIDGSNFAINGIPVPYGQYYGADYFTGQLTGTLANSDILNSRFYIDSAAAKIVLVPEPVTLLLLSLGGLLLRKKH